MTTVAEGEELDAKAEAIQGIVDDAIEEAEVVEEPDGQTALATNDPRSITNEVDGSQPTEAVLKVGKPKPIPVDHNYQPGGKVLIVMHCTVGDVTTGTGTRSHEVTPLEALLWENMHTTPGEAIAAISDIETRPQWTKNIVDATLSAIERMVEDGFDAFDSGPDLVEALHDELYQRYSIKSVAEEDPDEVDEPIDDDEGDEVDAAFPPAEGEAEGEW